MRVVMAARSGWEVLTYGAICSLAEEGTIEPSPSGEYWGVTVQQALSMLESHSTRKVGVRMLSEAASPLPWATRDLLDRALASMSGAGMLSYDDSLGIYRASDRASWLISKGVMHGNIVDAGEQGVDVFCGRSHLGKLPLGRNVTSGFAFRFAGRCWEVARVQSEGVLVRQIPNDERIPALRWPGAGVSTSRLVLHRMRECLSGTHSIGCQLLSPEAARGLGELQRWAGPRVDAGTVVAMSRQGLDGIESWEHLTFAGRLANRIIQRIFAHQVTDIGDVVVTASTPLNFSALPENAADLLSRSLKDWYAPATPWDSFLPTDLLRAQALASREAEEARSALEWLRSVKVLPVP